MQLFKVFNDRMLAFGTLGFNIGRACLLFVATHTAQRDAHESSLLRKSRLFTPLLPSIA
jgi:hypothetical protein